MRLRVERDFGEYQVVYEVEDDGPATPDRIEAIMRTFCEYRPIHTTPIPAPAPASGARTLGEVKAAMDEAFPAPANGV